MSKKSERSQLIVDLQKSGMSTKEAKAEAERQLGPSINPHETGKRHHVRTPKSVIKEFHIKRKEEKRLLKQK